MQIGEKIKNYRKTAGLTQEQVADYLDVSTPAVNKWESATLCLRQGHGGRQPYRHTV